MNRVYYLHFILYGLLLKKLRQRQKQKPSASVEEFKELNESQRSLSS